MGHLGAKPRLSGLADERERERVICVCAAVDSDDLEMLKWAQIDDEWLMRAWCVWCVWCVASLAGLILLAPAFRKS